jgi:hypothetical protein
MADSEDDPHVKLLGVKLKSSAVLENIVAGAVLALVGYVLLDVFNAFSNQLGWLMPKPGSTLANVIDMAKVGFATIFVGAFAYYINHLGLWTGNDAALAGLRTRLTAGESAGTWYARTVRSAISVTDTFFGDAGEQQESWVSKMFRLKESAPLWTAVSFDKCLLIALIYPLFCIYIVWAVWKFGHDDKFPLIVERKDIYNVITTICTAFGTWFCFYSIRINNKFIINAIWLSLGLIIFIAAGNYIEVLVISLAFASYGFEAILFIIIYSIFISILGEVSIKFLNNFHNNINNLDSLYVLDISSDTFSIFFTVYMTNKINKIKYIFLRHNILLYIITFLSCVAFPFMIGESDRWSWTVRVMYFIPLLALVNAPFDWAALGITRGLLRKGLEKRGLWPLGLGLLDLVISLLTIALLSITVLIVTQIFNATTMLGGTEKTVFDPLDALRDLANPATRDQPKYYWLYFMLLTTQFPAILNLAAGFLSVIRTRDFGNGLILSMIGDGQSLSHLARGLLGALQAVQLALALTAGALLFYALFIGFVTVEPLAGGGLIDLLLWIAEANWPARLLGVG